MANDKLFNGYFKGKKVLVTGHTGFKGSWLSIWLLQLGAEVIGYALDPKTSRDNFVLSKLSQKMTDVRADVRDYGKLEEVVLKYKPDIIFHLAAQALVRQSYEMPAETFDTNVMGTVNILEAFRNSPDAKSLVIITSDKCYENNEWVWGYRENDRVGGRDPYSASKGAAEIVSSSYIRSFFNPVDYQNHGKAVATVRAGNVLGGGDWAKDRIMTDCMNALENGEPIKVRNPKYTRPWQHVLEPLSGYMLLAAKLHDDPKRFSGAWNFGPHYSSIVEVSMIAGLVIKFYGKGSWEDVSNPDNVHEANLLSLDISRAKQELDWKPTLDIRDTIKFTVDWYRHYNNVDVYSFCIDQINEFTDKVNWGL